MKLHEIVLILIVVDVSLWPAAEAQLQFANLES